MNTEESKKQFDAYSRSDKVLFIVTFYQEMIKKTDNVEYQRYFQSIIDDVKSYQEGEENEQHLVDIHRRILLAQKRTQEKRMREAQEKMKASMDRVQQIQSQESDEDADAYLIEQLALL